jgi:hypothetical protein
MSTKDLKDRTASDAKQRCAGNRLYIGLESSADPLDEKETFICRVSCSTIARSGV